MHQDIQIITRSQKIFFYHIFYQQAQGIKVQMKEIFLEIILEKIRKILFTLFLQKGFFIQLNKKLKNY